MKVRCRYCDRSYNDPALPCPGCGAFNEAPPEPVKPQPAPHPTPVVPPPPAASSAQSTAIVLIGVVVLAISLIGIWLLNGNASSTSNTSSRIIGETAKPDYEASIINLYRQLEENPADFAVAVELTTILYAANKAGEAREVAMHLPRWQCVDAALYREVAAVMRQNNDLSYACRMYLCAYQLSNASADLAAATECGTPGELMPNGPTAQVLALFFQKPMSLVTWEEVGSIQYFASHYDYIELSAENPGDMEYEFEDTVQSFRFDRSEDAAYVYLYGLHSLEIYINPRLAEVNLFALQGLRALHIANMSGAADINDIDTIPMLESLHVGGSGITSLDGLDRLPKLHTLSLEGTSIETLSVLAGYRNVKHLSLKRNDELTGLSSLEMMDHLEGLHIERQAVLDFRFMERMRMLKELSIVNTGIKDIFFLSQLENLEALSIVQNNDLKTIAGIGELTGLRRLSVTANQRSMDGVGEIANLTNLEWLRLYSPTSLSMISGLTSIQVLELSSMALLDSLAPVANLVNLEVFRVDSQVGGHGSYSGSFVPLGSLPKLTHVSIPGWELYYSKVLFDIPTLTYLDLTGCRLEFAGSGLAKLTGVQTLKLSGTKWVKNVQIWDTGGITNIGWDNVDIDAVFATVAGLPALERLELAKINLADVSFMPSLPRIAYANLADNYITDIAPLSEAASLRQVNLSGNPVRDWSVAEGWTHVNVVR